MVHTAKNRNILLPKKLNQSTGKISNCQTSFNDASWGGSTRAYVQGIDTNLSNKYFDIIIDHAKGFARKSRHAAGASTENKTAESSAATKGLDKRSQLKDRPCSPDDEEIEYDGADEEDSEED